MPKASRGLSISIPSTREPAPKPPSNLKQLMDEVKRSLSVLTNLEAEWRPSVGTVGGRTPAEWIEEFEKAEEERRNAPVCAPDYFFQPQRDHEARLRREEERRPAPRRQNDEPPFRKNEPPQWFVKACVAFLGDVETGAHALKKELLLRRESPGFRSAHWVQAMQEEGRFADRRVKESSLRQHAVLWLRAEGFKFPQGRPCDVEVLDATKELRKCAQRAQQDGLRENSKLLETRLRV
jgi:hypothetical protein